MTTATRAQPTFGRRGKGTPQKIRIVAPAPVAEPKWHVGKKAVAVDRSAQKPGRAGIGLTALFKSCSTAAVAASTWLNASVAVAIETARSAVAKRRPAEAIPNVEAEAASAPAQPPEHTVPLAAPQIPDALAALEASNFDFLEMEAPEYDYVAEIIVAGEAAKDQAPLTTSVVDEPVPSSQVLDLAPAPEPLLAPLRPNGVEDTQTAAGKWPQDILNLMHQPSGNAFQSGETPASVLPSPAISMSQFFVGQTTKRRRPTGTATKANPPATRLTSDAEPVLVIAPPPLEPDQTAEAPVGPEAPTAPVAPATVSPAAVASSQDQQNAAEDLIGPEAPVNRSDLAADMPADSVTGIDKAATDDAVERDADATWGERAVDTPSVVVPFHSLVQPSADPAPEPNNQYELFAPEPPAGDIASATRPPTSDDWIWCRAYFLACAVAFPAAIGLTSLLGGPGNPLAEFNPFLLILLAAISPPLGLVYFLPAVALVHVAKRIRLPAGLREILAGGLLGSGWLLLTVYDGTAPPLAAYCSIAAGLLGGCVFWLTNQAAEPHAEPASPV